MSADFTTEIAMKGTREEYGALLRLLKYYTIDQQEAYRNGEDAWYFDESYLFDDIAEETIDDYYETYNADFFGIEITDEMVNVFIEQNETDGKLSLFLDGPYGRFGGPIDEIDFFERLADTVPTCWFSGKIDGSDPGGEQTAAAELKDGILSLQYTYREYGDDNSASWGKTYDPGTKTYRIQ